MAETHVGQCKLPNKKDVMAGSVGGRDCLVSDGAMVCGGSGWLVPGRSAHETPLEVAPVFDSDPADDIPE